MGLRALPALADLNVRQDQIVPRLCIFHVLNVTTYASLSFRDLRGSLMREKDCDYFENSQRSIDVLRQQAIKSGRAAVTPVGKRPTKAS